MIIRAATRGKNNKTAVLPAFCSIELGDGSNGMSLNLPLLWWICLTKIGGGGPDH